MKLFACTVLLLLPGCWCVASPQLEAVEYLGATAFRLSDGRTEAIIVPGFSGRIMRYGKVGERNWLWNSGPKAPGGKWNNLGGDKAFLGPHPLWKQFSKSIWPPQFSTWDGDAHQASILPNAHLRTIGPVWQGFGARIVREYSMRGDGSLLIDQRLEQVEPPVETVAIWVVSQLAPPEAVYIPLSSASIHPDGFQPLGEVPAGASLEQVSPALLRVQPTTGKSYKIGIDSPVSALAAVVEGVALVQRAASQTPVSPNGAARENTVEFYNHGATGAAQYIELELLSPKRRLEIGDSLNLSVRWSLHTLSAKGSADAPAATELEALLQAQTPASGGR